jgi:hypothetical protein
MLGVEEGSASASLPSSANKPYYNEADYTYQLSTPQDAHNVLPRPPMCSRSSPCSTCCNGAGRHRRGGVRA